MQISVLYVPAKTEKPETGAASRLARTADARRPAAARRAAPLARRAASSLILLRGS